MVKRQMGHLQHVRQTSQVSVPNQQHREPRSLKRPKNRWRDRRGTTAERT